MCEHATSSPPPRRITDEVAAILVANHRDFLRFVERRVGSRALAEEILQDAFVKNLPKLGTVRETAVGWFYRVLRNAIVDHRRRLAAADRRDADYALDLEATTVVDDELQAVVCKCIAELAATLRPAYADALRQIELDGVSVKDYAAQRGISASNAGVRVFRARQALRAQVARSCGTCASHGCLDCTCGTTTGACGEEPASEDVLSRGTDGA
jgi:RNA polymerase sigma-70 factor (ECF subfamily)